MKNAKPPILCAFCGVESVAKEPCSQCKRPNIPGEWAEVERGANARGVAVAGLVLLAAVWCIPIAWMIGGVSLLFHAAGVELSILKVSGDEMPLEGLLALGLGMPVLAVGVAVILRELTAKVIGDLIDTDWHFRPPRSAVTLIATTRGPVVRRAEGRVTYCEGSPATGADVSTGDVVAAGAADVARALGEHEHDVLFAMALAGMIARGEIEVCRSRTSRWIYGDPAHESTDWDVRVVRATENRGATETKLAAAAEQDEDADLTVAVASGYRETVSTPLTLGTSRLALVHHHAYGTIEDGPKAPGKAAADVAKCFREWAKSEPELYRTIIEMGEGARVD